MFVAPSDAKCWIYLLTFLIFLNFQPSETFQLCADVHCVLHRENNLSSKDHLVISTKENLCCVFHDIYIENIHKASEM